MERLRTIISFFKALVGSPEPQFTCGDCRRNAQCGLEPSDRCLVRIKQIEAQAGRRVRGLTSIGW